MDFAHRVQRSLGVVLILISASWATRYLDQGKLGVVMMLLPIILVGRAMIAWSCPCENKVEHGR